MYTFRLWFWALYRRVNGEDNVRLVRFYGTDKPEWYFIDETSNYVGPYRSRRDALTALGDYALFL